MRNRYVIKGDITEVFKHKGSTVITLIDTKDLEKLKTKKVTWCITIGGRNNTRYVKCSDGTRLHRFLLSPKRREIVDHINGDTLDNRRSNLRKGTQSLNMQNQANLRKDNKSGVRGVYWREDRQKWYAEIRLQGKKKHIGCFSSLKEAEKQVILARKTHMPFSQESENSEKV